MRRGALLLFGLLCAAQVLTAQEWTSSYEEALQQAETQDKPLILVFSGSDWCAPCKRLEREVWQSDTFKQYAQDHYVLYKADFPRKKKNQLPLETRNANKSLIERFNTKGFFPLVVVMDGGENVLGKTGYQRMKPDKYIKLLNSYTNR
ncbi:thioredoxin family protein [Flagellimonas sp. DF-77]|uniref:thioredoxin family protein n=1 Tax=Flagellimonas algarum TaxID=3230298 RepID=UPI003394A6E1